LDNVLELITNSRDADAQEVRVDYDYERDLLSISDDGQGMNRNDLKGFFLLGDSVKLQDSYTPSGRARVGRFGVATIVMTALGQEYELVTRKNGIENFA
jgi:HSP90 family molecular chaperone